jgi:exosome complex component CSL4
LGADVPDFKTPGDKVLPGDPLAYAEEFLTGEGTFEQDGIVRAARLGLFHLDTREMRATVAPFTSVPAQLKEGDYVYAKIDMLKTSMAGAEVLHIEGSERIITGDTNGTLHVSKIAKRYIQDPGREYRLGDVIRARVLEVKPSVQLSTEDPRCGAILALCLRDRMPLKRAGKGLECPLCGRKDTRNLAPDYGQVHVPAVVAYQVPQT